MADSREQRAAVKFCFLLGKTGTETLEMLKTAYKDDAIGKTQVFEWFSRFKNGEMSIDDKPRSGRPATARTDENVKKIREIILEDRRRTIEEIVELSGVTWSSVQRILTEDLGMRRVAAKFVPRLLTAEQKQRRVEACFALKEEFKNDSDFFSKVITVLAKAVPVCRSRVPCVADMYEVLQDDDLPSEDSPDNAEKEADYCYCRKFVADAQMIECDGLYCLRQWFHFYCAERRARNAQYERERREEVAAAERQLAEAVGCDPNVERRARNAQYERERREEVAEAERQLAEAVGCDPNCSLKPWQNAVHECNVLPIYEVLQDDDLPSEDSPDNAEKEADYCYCRKFVADAQMIECDGLYCLRQWFHFYCVGITTPPEGKK
ncbi:hypothetical protein PYW07_007914 [Mythimna separata]|uniref:Mos1 transposase HTH domain-containing protein n=1 Tax=Mythimna separata TaxID=271217 RepID=A0AAD8DUC9_MYTSE|nr:hypothetical protein PYW07_007914 [Mythimna separata]